MERGFLTQKGSPIINSDLIHKLPEAALLPNKATIIQGDLCHNYKTQTIEASPLPPHTTSHQAELIALTRALTLAKNLRVNIHSDSKYAL